MSERFCKRWIFCLVVALLVVTLLFVACSRKKSIPVPSNLSISGDVLTWDPVTGTLSYDVKVDDKEVYSVTEPSFTLPFSDYEMHSFAVRAITYNGTGKYSKTYTYARSENENKSSLHKLYAPFDITMTANRLMWGTVLNNNGYRIYLDNVAIVVPRNTYYYDFDFPEEGVHTYYIRIQTLGDDVTYSSSNLSTAYSVTVKNGEAPRLHLPTIEFTFDTVEKKLVWTNPYSAEAVTYLIFQEGISDAIASIPADGTRISLSYEPILTGARVSYKMQLISNDGLYLPSDFNQKITFPIADEPPADLALLPNEALASYAFSWSEVRFGTGYALEIDGVRYDAGTALAFAVPNSLGAGRHVARVLATGDGVWYGDSILFEGLVFYTADKGKITTRLDTPDTPVISYEEETLSFTLSSVERAAKYRFEFRTESGTQSLTAEFASFALKSNMIGDRQATEEERAVIQKIFAELSKGLRVSVSAIPADPLYAASLRSEERFFSTDNEASAAAAPQNLRYGSTGFQWSQSEEDEEVKYEILLDGEVYQTSDSLNVASGEHFARVRVKEEGALWSQEIVFRLPIDTAAPTDLSLSGNDLLFKVDGSVISYRLYVDKRKADGTYESSEEKVYPDGDRILLEKYITTDGEYVLQLVSIAKDEFYADSAPSRQIYYVKTDAVNGTQVKPYEPRTASELLDLLRNNPSSYFRLVANAEYDFSAYDFSSWTPFAFSGVLWGNGAALTGIKTGSPLFSSLTDATIRDLTIVTEGMEFSYSNNGFLAKEISSATLSDLVLSVKDNTSLTDSMPFGLVCYTAKDVTVRNLVIDTDLTFSSRTKVEFGGFSHTATGVFTGLKLKGNVTFSSGVDLAFGGVSVKGESELVSYEPTLTFTANVTGDVLFGGCSLDGVVRGSALDQKINLVANGAKVNYYGIAEKKVTVTDSTIAGAVQANASYVTLCGVAESDIVSVKGVTVSTLLDGTARTTLRVAGVAETVDAESVTTGLVFVGSIKCSSPDVEAAGCAFTMNGTHTVRAAGTFTVTGKAAKVASCALFAETLFLDNASLLSLNKVTLAEVGGAVLGVTDKLTTVTLSGSVQLNATECGELFFGGAALSGKQDLTIQNYDVTGTVNAESIRFGGVSCDADKVTLSASGLSVKNTKLTSGDILAAGAVVTASELIVTAGTSLCAEMSGAGTGEISGFGLQAGTRTLSDLSVDGSISLKGSGTLYGVADTAGAVEKIGSSVDVNAEGEVEAFALFRSLTTAEDLTYHDAAVTVFSDQGRWYGVVGSVKGGLLNKVTLSQVTLRADPLVKTGSSMLLYGVMDSASTLQNVTISDVTYEVGAYDTLIFGGVANELSTEGSDISLCYRLREEAASAEIGGAFLRASGALYRVTLGKAGDPLSFVLSGSVLLGGMVSHPGPLTVSGGSSLLDYDLTLTGNHNEVGGLFSSLLDGKEVTISEHKTTVTLSRSSGGALNFGGAAATVTGILKGARADLTLSGVLSEDVVGGIASELINGALVNCSVYGSVTAATGKSPSVGGLVCNATYSRMDGGATALTVTTSGAAGGIAASIVDCNVEKVYSVSRMKNKGAGLFDRVERVTITDCYFAGEVTEYALAGSASACNASGLYLDAALVAAEGIVAVGTGSLPYEVRSFGYGYRSTELDDDFTTDGLRYPYVTAIGRLPEETVRSTQPLYDEEGAFLRIDVERTLDLYTLLPRFRSGVAPTVTWVDESGKLFIQNGVASVVENGSGTLYGYVSGSQRAAYSVLYSASGFDPFTGDGSKEDPYVITDLRYFYHVAEYAEYFPTAYFLVDLEEEVTGAVFSGLFTSTAPFRGHLSFGGARLRSPVCGETGILGYLEGATISDLVLCGNLEGVILARYAKDTTFENITLESVSLAGECTLVKEMENTLLRSVTAVMQVMANAALDFSLVGTADTCTIETVSLSLSVNTHDVVSACLVRVAADCTVTEAQTLWWVKQCGKLSLSLSGEDHGSTYDSCMTLTEADAFDPEESLLAGLSIVAEDTAYNNCAVVMRVAHAVASPLIGEGTATYDELSLLCDGEGAGEVGVTLLKVITAKAALAAKDGYIDGVLATPIGYALFGESIEPEFDVLQEEIILSQTRSLSSLATLLGEKPFATFVGYEFDGACAVIQGDALRPTSDGTGTLTLTDLYGVSREIPVTVEGFVGFAEGTGSEDDPYLIDTFDDFLLMLASDDEDAYYALTGNIAGTVSESAVFRGTLTSLNYATTSTAYTVTVDLACDSLFSTGNGIVEGVNFVLNKDAFLAEQEEEEEGAEEEEERFCGLFAERADGMTVREVTFTVNCPTVTLSGVTFGYVAGVLEGSSVFENVTVALSVTTIHAADAVAGVLAGKLEGSILKDAVIERVESSDVVTLVGQGEVIFGALGKATAAEQTRTVYDPLSESETTDYYVKNVRVDLAFEASGERLILGGVAGSLGLAVNSCSVTLDLTSGGGEVTAGGIAGVNEGSVLASTATGTIVSSETLSCATVGGIAGSGSGSIIDCEVLSMTVSLTAAGKVFAGGALGEGSGDLMGLTLNANLVAHSTASGALGSDLLVAVGGAVGVSSGTLERISVTVMQVRATSDYVGETYSIYAGGLAGRACLVQNVEIKGTGTILASGGVSVAAGIAAEIEYACASAVVNGVTFSAESVAGGIGLLAIDEGEGRATTLFVHLAGLSEDTPALVGRVGSEATVECGRYLSGKAVGEAEAESLDDLQQASASQFLTMGFYAALDGDVWRITAGTIPTLKKEEL